MLYFSKFTFNIDFYIIILIFVEFIRPMLAQQEQAAEEKMTADWKAYGKIQMLNVDDVCLWIVVLVFIFFTTLYAYLDETWEISDLHP